MARYADAGAGVNVLKIPEAFRGVHGLEESRSSSKDLLGRKISIGVAELTRRDRCADCGPDQSVHDAAAGYEALMPAS